MMFVNGERREPTFFRTLPEDWDYISVLQPSTPFIQTLRQYKKEKRQWDSQPWINICDHLGLSPRIFTGGNDQAHPRKLQPVDSLSLNAIRNPCNQQRPLLPGWLPPDRFNMLPPLARLIKTTNKEVDSPTVYDGTLRRSSTTSSSSGGSEDGHEKNTEKNMIPQKLRKGDMKQDAFVTSYINNSLETLRMQNSGAGRHADKSFAYGLKAKKPLSLTEKKSSLAPRRKSTDILYMQYLPVDDLGKANYRLRLLQNTQTDKVDSNHVSADCNKTAEKSKNKQRAPDATDDKRAVAGIYLLSEEKQVREVPLCVTPSEADSARSLPKQTSGFSMDSYTPQTPLSQDKSGKRFKHIPLWQGRSNTAEPKPVIAGTDHLKPMSMTPRLGRERPVSPIPSFGRKYKYLSSKLTPRGGVKYGLSMATRNENTEQAFEAALIDDGSPVERWVVKKDPPYATKCRKCFIRRRKARIFVTEPTGSWTPRSELSDMLSQIHVTPHSARSLSTLVVDGVGDTIYPIPIRTPRSTAAPSNTPNPSPEPRHKLIVDIPTADIDRQSTKDSEFMGEHTLTCS